MKKIENLDLSAALSVVELEERVEMAMAYAAEKKCSDWDMDLSLEKTAAPAASATAVKAI